MDFQTSQIITVNWQAALCIPVAGSRRLKSNYIVSNALCGCTPNLVRDQAGRQCSGVI
jgi:hypothetical protein